MHISKNSSTFALDLDQVNSGSTKAQAIFDEATLYPNPYMVVTRKGYTKHYYAGTERLATVIGQGGFKDVTYPTDKFLPYEKNIVASFYSRYLSTYDPFYYHGTLGNLVQTTDIHGDPNPDLQYQCKPTVLEFVDVLNQSDMLLKSISSNEHINNDEKEKFFYHGDHLGSASWITDYQGNPVQYIHYAPYGELIADQRIARYNERYKFTGKERDRETGYDYYGARYLWSDAGIFISPDPLSDKDPGISSYAYCGWNPIKYIDPDGRKAVVAGSIAQKRLLSTLSCSERNYVSFDKNGNINASRLNRCKSTSHNMTALKALTNSKDVTYNFLVQGKSSNGETDMHTAGGVTEMYGLDKDASPDPSVVNIISGDHLTGEAAAKNMAHEAFVHAYLYETNGHDGRAAGHDRPNIKSNWGGYTDPNTGVEYPEFEGVYEDHPNDLLNQYNEKAQREASVNFNCGL